MPIWCAIMSLEPKYNVTYGIGSVTTHMNITHNVSKLRIQNKNTNTFQTVGGQNIAASGHVL